MSKPFHRPCKLTPESQARFIEAILQGATYLLASNYAGVDYSNYRKWMIKGESTLSGKYRDFYDAVKKAEGEAAVKWLKVIEAASVKDWQAAAWKLERRYWKGYSRHTDAIALGEEMEDFKEQLKKGDLKNGKANNGTKEEDSEE